MTRQAIEEEYYRLRELFTLYNNMNSNASTELSFSILEDFLEYNGFSALSQTMYINSMISNLKQQLSENRLWMTQGRFRNLFPWLFHQEDVDFYVEDNQIIKDLVTYLMAFSTTYEIIRKEIMNSSKIDKLDAPNKPIELKKILDFMNFLYLDTIEHYHSQRRYLEQKYELLY